MSDSPTPHVPSGFPASGHNRVREPTHRNRALISRVGRNMGHLIEDYALIGDRGTAALIGRNGSIDWLCWPRLNGEACLGRRCSAAVDDDSNQAGQDLPGTVSQFFRRPVLASTE
jgi:hypothetical protein